MLGACDGGGGGGAESTEVPPLEAEASVSRVDPAELYRDGADAGLAGSATGDLADAIVGAPGETVDCADSLPCRWVGDDAGFAVTATRADNTGRDGRFELHLVVDSTHDTALGVALAADAIDATGHRAAPARVAFDGAPVNGARALAGGERLDARIDFDAPVAGTTLPAWSLLLDDNGTPRPATFANLPVGPVSSAPVDCAGTLPCLWTSDDGLASLELVGAGGFASERRLHVDLRIVATRAIALVAGPETLATGAGGNVFEARSKRMGTTAAGIGESVPVAAGSPIDARVDFFRTAGTATLLDTLVLDLYRDAPVPRWRPRFANVPALAP